MLVNLVSSFACKVDAVSNNPNIRQQATPTGGFSRVTTLIGFLGSRRVDNSHPVWPVKLLLGVFALVSVLVVLSINFIDKPFWEYVTGTGISDNDVLNLITRLGKSKWYLIISSLLIVLFLFLSADRVDRKLLPAWCRSFFSIWFFLYSMVMSGLIAIVFKWLFGRTRPKYSQSHDPFEFNPFSIGYEVNSFPSGHATTAGSIAIVLALLFPKYKWPIIISFAFVASTRALIGVHYVSDVITGFALGATVTWIYARSMAKRRILFQFTPSGSLSLRRTQYASKEKIIKMTGETIGKVANSDKK